MSDKIPLSIWRQIFLRLPAEFVFRLRDVCKRWRLVIDDPSFVKAHTNNNHLSSNTLFLRHTTGPPFHPIYSFNLETLSFANGPQTITVTPNKLTRRGLSRLPSFPVPTCNGLMLIAPMGRESDRDSKNTWDRDGALEIWNPLTRERLNVPQPNIASDVDVVGIGIGYDCVADDYKVVVIDYLYRYREAVLQTHVYSLKSDSWRKLIGNCPFDPPWGDNKRGVFLNGALYWATEGMIIVLDLVTERYCQLEFPPRLSVRKHIHLDALDGCLILSYYSNESSKQFEGWVMNDYGDGYSWTMLFTLYLFDLMDRDLRPVAYMKNKRQVLMQHFCGTLLLDVDSNSKKTVSIHGISTNFTSQICGGSLFRLHDSCGSVGSKRRLGKRKRKMTMADTKLTFCVRDNNV